MLPPVALHDTAISALSPVAVKPTARKSSAWFCCSVTFCGETTSCAMLEPGSVTGCSQLTTIAATATAAGITVQAFSRAKRAANLLKAILRREELAHVRRTGRRAWEDVHPKALQDQTQCALMLVQRRGLIATFGLRAHGHPYNPPTAVGVVAARL